MAVPVWSYVLGLSLFAVVIWCVDHALHLENPAVGESPSFSGLTRPLRCLPAVCLSIACLHTGAEQLPPPNSRLKFAALLTKADVSPKCTREFR